jgi:hypothetical protein
VTAVTAVAVNPLRAPSGATVVMRQTLPTSRRIPVRNASASTANGASQSDNLDDPAIPQQAEKVCSKATAILTHPHGPAPLCLVLRLYPPSIQVF